MQCLHSHFAIRCHQSLIQWGPHHLIKRYTRAPDMAHWVVTCWPCRQPNPICSSQVDGGRKIFNRKCTEEFISPCSITVLTCGSDRIQSLPWIGDLLICGLTIGLQTILDPLALHLNYKWRYHRRRYVITVLLVLLVSLERITLHRSILVCARHIASIQAHVVQMRGGYLRGQKLSQFQSTV